MSASYICTCECGLEYEVVEHAGNVVFLVDGIAEVDCPKCDAPLTVDGAVISEQ